MNRQTRLRKKQILLKRQDNVCAYCYKGVTLETVTVDHVVPRSKRGGDALTNLVGACYKCNQKKGARTDVKPQYLTGSIIHTDYGEASKRGKTFCVYTCLPKTFHRFDEICTYQTPKGYIFPAYVTTPLEEK